MSEKIFAYVGNWDHRPMAKGLSIFSYNPESAGMEPIETLREDVAVGNQCWDYERKILYIMNECGSRRSQIGGGGYVMAYKADSETGKLTLMNEKESLCPNPTYFCLDKSKKYALVSHHCERGHVTRVIKKEDGSFASETLFDDAGLVLFGINSDGSLGEVLDVSITPGDGEFGPHSISHQHSVIADPSSELFIVSDKGTDKIFTFHLDRENKKLVPMQTINGVYDEAPRYGKFHPVLPVFYGNNERSTALHAFHYDVESGNLECFSTIDLLPEDYVKVEGVRIQSSDIIVHPNGKFLYGTVRGAECIAVMDIEEKGRVTLKQNADCGGKNPRGLCISPDLRFMLCTNMESGTVTAMPINEDGTLGKPKTVATGTCPGNLSFLAV